jgi:signal transduction histidine kinase
MERRRLERNLHDGAQQNLVALKVKLALLENLAEQQPAKAKKLAGELKVDADETLDTLRDLARGIYPPLLADKGLAAALEAQARKATLPVDVETEGIDRYPQEIEAAVYFCVLEALQNVQKYASASSARVHVAVPNGRLEFTVEDNGAGFDSESVAKGAGLQNMVDRLEALGGELQIVASPGGGTRVVGALPIGSAPGDANEVRT